MFKIKQKRPLGIPLVALFKFVLLLEKNKSCYILFSSPYILAKLYKLIDNFIMSNSQTKINIDYRKSESTISDEAKKDLENLFYALADILSKPVDIQINVLLLIKIDKS